MKLPRDRLIVLKEITAAMYPGIEPTIAKFAKMSASRFFATFGTVRPGALVRLAGVLLIKLYSSRRQTTEPPAAQQAENAEGAENGTGAVAEQDAVKKPSGRRSRLLQTAKRLKEVRKAVEEDEQREKQLAGEESLLTASAEEAVFDEVRKLVLFVYACSNIPATGSPLGVVAKEIVDVWKAELTDSRFTRCFHAMADKWRAINQQKSSGTQFKSLSKGRQLVEVNPDKRRRIVPKARQMLPTTDGSTAMPGGRRRSSAAKAPTKKSTQKRKKGGR
ncbi:hypothetical protein DIPPA_21079 [Diplonema papillatum]|nr:hypothetical protein DIPPA_21079 [Diplonema papillatum]